MRTEYLEVLELLPVWQLRKPLPEQQAVISEGQQDAEPVAQNPVDAAEPQASPTVMMFASETGALRLIHHADGLTNDAQTLLQNIANSMQLKRQQASSQSLVEALQQPTTVLLVLGEALAKTVLSSQQDLQQLRGKLHAVDAMQVIVSYDLETMLDQPAIKAQVWQDCCLAMSLLTTS